MAGARRTATIYDVARLAGVSHQTVSRHLRGIDIRPSMRERVEAAMRELDFRANVAAQNLRRGRTSMIALSIPSLNQPYFAELAQSVVHAARAHDLTVFVETTENERGRELATLEHIRTRQVDGILFVSSVLEPSDLAEVPDGAALVLIGDRLPGGRFDHVTMANRAAAERATSHLVQCGRRRIVALGAQEPSTTGAAPQRLAGYRAALARNGISAVDELVVHADEWVRASGVAGIEAVLSRGVSFDAVFGFNDALSLGALRALQSAGLRVPQDVMVVGFDDTEDARFSTPSLTSIAPGRDAIAARAVELLVARIAGNDLARAELTVDFLLVERESTDGLGPSGRR